MSIQFPRRFHHWLNNHSRWRSVVACVFVALLIVGSLWLYPRVSCALDGGQWVRGGVLGQAQYCQYTYEDGGNLCHSSDECMGGCIVTDWPVEGQPVPTVGVCKLNNSPFGCYAPIEFPEMFRCAD